MQEHDNYLAAVHENSLAVSEHTAASDLLERIVARAAQAVGTAHGSICLIEHDPNAMLLRGMVLCVGVGAGIGWVGMRVVRPKFPLCGARQGVCLRKCAVVWCCLTTRTRGGGRRRGARRRGAGGGWAW
jgi:hypothetical protein